MRFICRFIFFKLLGWHQSDDFPAEKKLIVIMLPHTSNWDFLMGWLFYCSHGRKPRFLIKPQWFVFPVGWLVRAMGGVPIERGDKSAQSLLAIKKDIESSKEFLLNITPEGTRSRVNRWKKGFHLLARQLELPIMPGYLDYKKKEVGINPLFYVSDDFSKDAQFLKQYYEGVTARHPENFNIDCIR